MEAILPIALIAFAFYLLVFRPMQMRKRRTAELRTHLKPGVEVITTAGIFGRVERVSDDEVFLEIAPGVVIRTMAAAVGSILNRDGPGGGEQAGSESTAGGANEPDDDPKPPKTL